MGERTFELLLPNNAAAHLRRRLANKSVFIVGPDDAGFLSGEEGRVPVIFEPRLRPGALSVPIRFEVQPEMILPTAVILNVKLSGLRRGRKGRTLRRTYLFLPPLFDFALAILEGGRLGISDGRAVAIIELRAEGEAETHLRRMAALLRILSSAPDEVLADMHVRAYLELQRAFPRAPWLRDYARRIDQFLEEMRRRGSELIDRALDIMLEADREVKLLDYVG